MIRLAAAFLAALTLTGCAALQPKKPEPKPDALAGAKCLDTPQFRTTLADGRPAGVFVCFGANNALLYVVRPLPPEPVAPVVAPKPKKKAK
jgi:hypothetical protein